MMSCSSGITEDENLIENLMSTQPDKFGKIVSDLDKFEVQIIYSRIIRDSLNNPSFRTFYFNHDPEKYFYPASTVKLPASLAALEKINKLNVPRLTKSTIALSDSAWSGQSAVMHDSTSENHMPSIGHYIKKILLVSDNDAHNRLYEFLGQRPFNESMWSKGFDETRMTHRLSIFLEQDENATTNPMRFLDGDSVIYSQEMVINEDYIQAKDPIMLGEAHYSGGELISEPMNFQYKNFFPLEEQHDLLKAIFFAEHIDPSGTFYLTEEDYRFVWKYMSQLPSETTFPNYTSLPDHYVKFFLYGDGSTPVRKDLRVFNKVGQAYGYLIDNAYIVDFTNNLEFLVSAVINVNDNKTLNDGNYEYDEVGFPFFSDLGKIFYEYELANPPEISPDLSHLQMTYDK